MDFIETSLTLDQLRSSKNIAELLSDRDLHKIGDLVKEGYRIDEDSRESWVKTTVAAMDIATQVMEEADWPFENAANIKLPIITRACIDYASRTMPEIIQSDNIVKFKVIGADPDGKKHYHGQNVANYLNYQLFYDMDDWEDGTDRLLQMLPVVGTVFKKTYWDESAKKCISETIAPDKICVNYNTKSLDTARRVTHVLHFTANDILERQRSGLYLDSITLDELSPDLDQSSSGDSDFDIKVLEQHCYLDLDNDGYKEPYIVTLLEDSGKVCRIVHRFDGKVVKNKKDQVISIKPKQYFTDWHFIRSPDGGYYSMGFGSLLLPMNTATNMITNILINSGIASSTPGGLISGRVIKFKTGEISIEPNKYQVVDTTAGMDMRQGILEWPTKEPSPVLFQLLQFLQQSAMDLSSSTDVLMGKQPAQNVASSTVAQLTDQSTKVFKAINKRVVRAFRKEYYKLFCLNKEHPDDKKYQQVLDLPDVSMKEDFNEDYYDIYPVADPLMSSDQQKIQKLSVIQQLQSVDRRAADKMALDSLGIEESEKKSLLPDPDPNAPPPPEVQKLMAEITYLEAQIANLGSQTQLEAQKAANEVHKQIQANKESESRINESMMRSWKMQQDALEGRDKIQLAAMKMKSQQEMDQFNMVTKADMDMKNHALEATKLMSDAKKTRLAHDLEQKKLEKQAAGKAVKK